MQQINTYTIDFYRKLFRKLLFLIVMIGMFFGGHHALASGDTLQIVFKECAANICTRIHNENTSYALFSALEAGQKVKLQVSISNPQQRDIYSAESWITFSPDVFSINNLSAEGSDFPLEAPGEFTIDNVSGTLKIGRAIAGNPVSKTDILIASFEVTAKKNSNGASLSFVDYRTSDVGKTSVLTIENMLPQNILTTKPKNLLFSNGESHSAPNTYTTPPQYQPQQNGTSVYGVNTSNTIPSFVDIPRPTGLRTRTYRDGRTEHLWKMGSDSRIVGYYLYYSTKSGEYMHRRDMGKTNVYRFPNNFFEKGKRVYFSVQAYDQSGKLSDFSDETYVTIGTAGSESHPFFEQIFPNVPLDNQGKAYRNEQGQTVQNPTQTTSPYSANLSQKYPQQNPQSGNSNDFIFILIGIGFLLFGGRKWQQFTAEKRTRKEYERQLFIQKFYG